MGHRLPHIKGLLLDYLSRQGEMTGYAFLRYCREEGMPVSNGTVYPHLRHLEQHGVIMARTEGRKRIYTLTGKGRAMVRLHESKPAELRKNLLHFLHVFSMPDWNRPENVAILRACLAAMDRDLAQAVGHPHGSARGQPRRLPGRSPQGQDSRAKA